MSDRKSTKIECICQTCKSIFLIHPCRAKFGNARFCSRKCRRAPLIEMSCQKCGKLFFTKGSRIKQERGKFCSMKCAKHNLAPLEERFLSYVGSKNQFGCMEWTGCISMYGYGKIGDHKKIIAAHRLAWELANGPILDGLCVLHKCDNRRCVNVDHLFLGTIADNNADCINKGRNSKGESHYAAKLSTEQVRLIRERYATKMISQEKLAEEFGVTQTAISRVVLRKIRKNG